MNNGTLTEYSGIGLGDHLEDCGNTQLRNQIHIYDTVHGFYGISRVDV
jgi:hypothetical protein